MFMLVATFWYSDESGIQEQQYHVVQLGTCWVGRDGVWDGGQAGSCMGRCMGWCMGAWLVEVLEGSQMMCTRE